MNAKLFHTNTSDIDLQQFFLFNIFFPPDLDQYRILHKSHKSQQHKCQNFLVFTSRSKLYFQMKILQHRGKCVSPLNQPLLTGSSQIFNAYYSSSCPIPPPSSVEIGLFLFLIHYFLYENWQNEVRCWYTVSRAQRWFLVTYFVK